jgi:hypothetical protein
MNDMPYTREAQALMGYALSLIEHLEELGKVYEALFEDVMAHNPDKASDILPVVVELSENLTDIQDKLAGQIYLASGVYEPIPVDTVEDFEAAVLTTLAGLDTVDLEKYRIEGSSRE